MPQKIDSSVLEMTLVGYEAKLQKLQERINAIREQIGVRSNGAKALTSTDGTKPKRVLSAAAKKRIAIAQRKHWAAVHAKHKAPATKAALPAKLAKARAARAAKKAAA